MAPNSRRGCLFRSKSTRQRLQSSNLTRGQRRDSQPAPLLLLHHHRHPMPAPHPALVAGNTAVVTGAAVGGIGYSIALQLLQRYGLKVLLSDLKTDALKETTEALLKAGVNADAFYTHATDVSSWEEVKELSDIAFEKLGQVDVLILNAGTQLPTKDFTDIDGAADSLKAWNQTLGVNFYGVLHGTQVSEGRARGFAER